LAQNWVDIGINALKSENFFEGVFGSAKDLLPRCSEHSTLRDIFGKGGRAVALGALALLFNIQNRRPDGEPTTLSSYEL
jgi:hypothetical protein